MDCFGVSFKDATGLSRGVSRWQSYTNPNANSSDATGLPRGVLTISAILAGNVSLHGSRPWHPVLVICRLV